MNVRQVFTADLYEQYIQLMCTKDPTAVLEYVKTKGIIIKFSTLGNSNIAPRMVLCYFILY